MCSGHAHDGDASVQGATPPRLEVPSGGGEGGGGKEAGKPDAEFQQGKGSEDEEEVDEEEGVACFPRGFDALGRQAGFGGTMVYDGIHTKYYINMDT